MANDEALRSALVWLAAAMVVVGLWTHSFTKVMATYGAGMLGIAGVLLPDWDYFDRDFSKWTTPVSAEERAAVSSRRSRFPWSAPLSITSSLAFTVRTCFCIIIKLTQRVVFSVIYLP